MKLFRSVGRDEGAEFGRRSRNTKLEAVIGDYQLAPFPVLISQALQLIGDPDFDLGSVSELLKHDPAITVRLLGLVNSAALSRGRTITNVHQAAVIVGRNQLESLLISLAVRSALPSPSAPGFDRSRFWTAAARRASIAGRLSSAVDPSRRSDNFTVALLQDMALPVLVERADGYSQTLLDWHGSATDLAVLEQAAHGWDHGEIASLMASAWGLPTELVDFLRDHHSMTTLSSSDVLAPARVVAPVRESEPVGDEQMVQLATDVLSLSGERVLELIEESQNDATHLAGILA